MTEDSTPDLGGDGEPRTGVPAVDAVLDEVDGLADRPVAEHVAVYERAHDTLRRALDPGAPDDETA